MSKRLILMRHAKSSWDDPLSSDHDRVLNARGRAAAAAVSGWLKTRGYLPDQAIVSSAKRTLETAERLGLNIDITAKDALYHAGEDRMLEVLKRASGAVVVMVGHNPGIAEFAARLLAVPPAHPRFGDFPTAAILVADFDVENWSALRFGQGQLVEFIVPADLEVSQRSPG